MVFQDPGSQLLHLGVDDEVAFGLRNLGLPESEVRTRVAWALSAVGFEELENIPAGSTVAVQLLI